MEKAATSSTSKFPSVPKGWSIKEHSTIGVSFLLKAGITLHREPEQQGLGRITGTRMQRLLSGMRCYNAKALEYLLNHPQRIPNEWKRYQVYFWGTIFRAADDSLQVAYLSYEGTTWERKFHNLNYLFGEAFPAAVCKLAF